MFKGTIYITHDPNLCIANLGKCKSIVVADNPDIYNIPGKIGGSLLLPPYEALAALIDDDEELFNYEYIKYLSTDITVNKFINILLQALIAGTNIILFIETEGPNFIMTLKEYFMNSFGILIGDESCNFNYNIAFFPIILSRLYMCDDISKEYFLQLYPENAPFEANLLYKLSYEYGYRFNNDIEAGLYFKKLSEIYKNGGMVKGVIRRL